MLWKCKHECWEGTFGSWFYFLSLVSVALYSISYDYLVKNISNIIRWTAGEREYFFFKHLAVTCMVLSLYILKPPQKPHRRKKSSWQLKRAKVSDKVEANGNGKSTVWSAGSSCHFWLTHSSRARPLGCFGSPHLRQTLFYLLQENDPRTHACLKHIIAWLDRPACKATAQRWFRLSRPDIQQAFTTLSAGPKTVWNWFSLIIRALKGVKCA